MNEESKNRIEDATKKLIRAKTNLAKATALRQMIPRLHTYNNSVMVDRGILQHVFSGVSHPSWLADILRDAMKCGCKDYAEFLEREANELSLAASAIIANQSEPQIQDALASEPATS